MEIANRVEKIKSFQVMALLEKAKAMEASGRDIIHMEVGEPDFPTPAAVIAAGQQALCQGLTRYTPATGLPELRAAVALYYQQRYGVEIAPQRIVITPGASGALSLVTALLFNAGDGVLLADPGYPCNSHFLHLLGAEPQWVATHANTAFQLTDELVRAHWQANTRGVLVASPSNPTGSLINMRDMLALKQCVDELDGVLVVDEIYQGLTYGSDATTVLAMTHKHENLVVINSFSKYFGMTGWRLGWIVAPEKWVPHLDRMAQNFYLAPPTISQYAALAAFQPETIVVLEQQRMQLKERRDYLLQALPNLGFKIPVVPEGAFYIYADVSGITDDSFQFCEQLLQETGVAITPGNDFGHHTARSHVRLAYTNNVERLKEAVQRIEAFLKVRCV